MNIIRTICNWLSGDMPEKYVHVDPLWVKYSKKPQSQKSKDRQYQKWLKEQSNDCRKRMNDRLIKCENFIEANIQNWDPEVKSEKLYFLYKMYNASRTPKSERKFGSEM